jgi:hypothetical protein
MVSEAMSLRERRYFDSSRDWHKIIAHERALVAELAYAAG